MNNSLEKLFAFGKKISMTTQEKNVMRSHLVQHMQTPQKSIHSTYFFRFVTTGVFALFVFITSTGIVSAAAQTALPGEFLYPVKRATESVKKVTLVSSIEKTNYEFDLIEKRFTETQDLISEKKLTDSNEAIITQSIKAHTSSIQKEATKIAEKNPSGALAYNNKLADLIDTKTEILLAQNSQNPESEQSDEQSIRIVLAVNETVQEINEQQKNLEEIILADTNIATAKIAEEKFAIVINLSENRPELFTSTTSATMVQPITAALAMRSALATSTTLSVSSTSITNLNTSATLPIIKKEKNLTLFELFKKIKEKYDAKEYGQVIIIAEQIEQKMRERDRVVEQEKISTETQIEINDVIKTEPATSGTSLSTGISITLPKEITAPQIATSSTLKKMKESAKKITPFISQPKKD